MRGRLLRPTLTDQNIDDYHCSTSCPYSSSRISSHVSLKYDCFSQPSLPKSLIPIFPDLLPAFRPRQDGLPFRLHVRQNQHPFFKIAPRKENLGRESLLQPSIFARLIHPPEPSIIEHPLILLALRTVPRKYQTP